MEEKPDKRKFHTKAMYLKYIPVARLMSTKKIIKLKRIDFLFVNQVAMKKITKVNTPTIVGP